MKRSAIPAILAVVRTYLRNRTLGGTYFFTVNLAERQGNTLLTDNIDLLREAFRRTLAEYPVAMDAIVVLPDHLHCLWRMPEGDDNYASRWRLIKAGFSRAMAKGERQSASRLRKGERGIWQRRYWEHLIRDETDYARHVDYIHYNPVKHGYVAQARDWPYSTFPRWVERGVYTEGWGVGNDVRDMNWE
ncbi:transposase [Pseudoxanthomonas sangjuensis]|uniref:REP-associated tyrosine transposase n=1 Tax=Pseudoxanthomonas sangjuensis TaxID=1503750 RepID=UPI001FEB24BB|nr:transposase [Pseudoxanthomonas sangjuensis]